MFTAQQISSLGIRGLFSTAAEFDLAVRRFNQDLNKLVVLARRNATKIHHVCLLQSRENSRVRMINKNKKREDREKPRLLCKAK